MKQKRLRSTKRHFSYESHDQTFSDALRKLDSSMLLLMQPRQPSQRGFPHWKMWETNSKLTNFPSLADEELAEQCNALGTTLHFEGHSDLDSRELVQEIKNFPHLPSKPRRLLELITFMQDKDLSEIYPNFWTALRIALTLPVTVTQAERSFSKLKLIKSLIRSTMSQEWLTGLDIINISHSIEGK